MPSTPYLHKQLLVQFVYPFMNKDALWNFLQTNSLYRDTAAYVLFKTRGEKYIWLTRKPSPVRVAINRAVKNGDVAQCMQLLAKNRRFIVDTFEKACIEGNALVAKKIAGYYPRYIRVYASHIFASTCMHGKLHIARWLRTQFYVNPREFNRMAFRKACAHGHLEVAKWLRSEFHMTINDVRYHSSYAFRRACAHGHMNVVLWLVETFPEIDDSDVRAGHDYAFSEAAANGQLHVITWLTSFFRSTTEQYTRRKVLAFFKRACARGHLHVAKWLRWKYSITSDSILEFGVLYNTCHWNRIEVVRWLVSILGVEQFRNDDYTHYALRIACHEGSLALAKWLYECHGVHGSLQRQTVAMLALEEVCKFGHLACARWLGETFDLSTVDTKKAFRNAERSGNKAIISWMKEAFLFCQV